MHKISDTVNRKFTDVISVDEWDIMTDTGWEPVSKIMQTIEYEIYTLTLADGKKLHCADEHIVIMVDGSEAFVKDLISDDLIQTVDGSSRVSSVIRTGIFERMYDIEVSSVNHTFYSDGILSHNTTSVATFILWFAMFHSDKECAILANKGAQAQEVVDRIRMMYEYLPFFLQVGAQVYNKTKLVFDNRSIIFSAATSASSIRGHSVALLYIDEAAFIENDMQFYESTYPVISSGATSRVIMTSTPKGKRGMFHKLYADGLEQKNDYKVITVKWDHHPNRGEKWREQTLRNTSKQQFAQEFECSFLGSSGTLIDSDALQALVFKNPINHIEEILDDGTIIEKVNGDEHLFIYEKYDPKHKYVAIADPSEGIGQDYSVCTVIDVTQIPYKVVAKYRNNYISPILFPHTIVSMGEEYGFCPVLVESNNACGGQVAYILYYELEYENTVLTKPDPKGRALQTEGRSAQPGVKTSVRVKSIGCANLKTLIENNALEVNDFHIVEELGTYIQKGKSYEADEDCHDDTVMTLVLFAWFVKQDFFADYADSDIGKFLFDKNRMEIEAELLPFGFIQDSGNSHDEKQELPVINGVPTVMGPAGGFDAWMAA